MLIGNGLLYPVVGLASCVAFIYMSFGDVALDFTFELSFRNPKMSFVRRNGTHFMLDGKPFYVNGWNSWWLMDQSVEEFSKARVKAMFQAASKMGLTVCRTWAFNDGAYNALQVSLGQFDERVFQALDRVIHEARKQQIRLVLSLSDDLPSFGGKRQYVKWAWEEGIGSSSSNDSFFFDPSIRNYYKSYLKGWIEEMGKYVKSIDKNHLVTIGLEGFYGPISPPEKVSVNPGEWFSTLGTDFIRNSKTPYIDFASVHIYPDQWLVNAQLEEKIRYISKWIKSHIDDGDKELKKPVVFSEFGLSNKNKDFDHSHRDEFYRLIYDLVYKSARRNGAGAGAFIWQLFVGGMEEYNDDFGFIPDEWPSLFRLLNKQSCRLERINYGKNFRNSC